ncbi:MAG: 5-(carboxyamino)imidazole ribonucleotide mutase [Oscillospiraceae bacterium]|nr:5-(carboxyamino)imidazole ribonucleotide mutase [Oscillospiraceae bacterium]
MKVGIIMGSDSDLPVMRGAADFLREMDVAFELTVVSAHRTPDRLYEYATTAKERGLGVIIAGAGGAAHLPGMAASLTTLPVIGVPVQTKALGGVDSLHSIVQMPPGIPVATMAINGATNAGILATSILAITDPVLADRLADYKRVLNDLVLGKVNRLDRLGYEQYLLEMEGK